MSTCCIGATNGSGLHLPGIQAPGGSNGSVAFLPHTQERGRGLLASSSDSSPNSATANSCGVTQEMGAPVCVPPMDKLTNAKPSSFMSNMASAHAGSLRASRQWSSLAHLMGKDRVVPRELPWLCRPRGLEQRRPGHLGEVPGPSKQLLAQPWKGTFSPAKQGRAGSCGSRICPDGSVFPSPTPSASSTYLTEELCRRL